VIFFGDVAADADGEEAVQAGFLSAAAAAVAEDAAAANDEDVGDQLFEAFVLLGFGAVAIEEAGGGGEGGQIFFDVETEPLEDAQFIEQFSLETKHSFFGCHGNIVHRGGAKAMAKMAEGGA